MIKQSITRRRWMAATASAGALVASACGSTAGTGSGTGSTGAAPTARSKAPVTIEVLTRNGVTSPSGHSQFYAKQAKNLFTPETNITVNLVDAQPNVG